MTDTVQGIDLPQYPGMGRTFDQLIIANRKNHDFGRAAALLTDWYLLGNGGPCRDRKIILIYCIDLGLPPAINGITRKVTLTQWAE